MVNTLVAFVWGPTNAFLFILTGSQQNRFTRGWSWSCCSRNWRGKRSRLCCRLGWITSYSSTSIQFHLPRHDYVLVHANWLIISCWCRLSVWTVRMPSDAQRRFYPWSPFPACILLQKTILIKRKECGSLYRCQPDTGGLKIKKC